MTTGEIANGMSINAFRNALPRNFWRTRTSAVRTPNTVLIGTAISTVMIVSFRAWRPASLVTASNDSMKPSSKVRMKIMITGMISSAAR